MQRLLFIKYQGGVASSGTTFIPDFVRDGQLVQKLKGAYTYTDVLEDHAAGSGCTFFGNLKGPQFEF
jgi:hypothetical protein